MNTFPIRSLLALSIAALLSACGGDLETTATVQTAAMMQTSLYAADAGAGAQAVVAQVPASQLPAAQRPAAQAMAAQTAATAQAANGEPQPDCAPQGCKSLRIIDANAEMYRLEAQRSAALDDDGDPAA
jgi:type IV pilus biogenesis protein CpaD/CtpE